MIQYYVDIDGKYLGAFDGIAPDGGLEVPSAPDDGRFIWDFDLEVWTGTTPKEYSVWEYVANYTGDRSLAPYTVDYKNGLITHLYPVPSFAMDGRVEEIVYYFDRIESYDEDLLEWLVSYNTPVLVEAFTYGVTDTTTTVIVQTKFYFSDGFLDEVNYKEETFFQDKEPVLQTYVEQGGIVLNAMKNVGDPVDPNDASTKGYADGLVGDALEQVEDIVAILIQDGLGISWTYNDPAGTLTPEVTLTPFSTTDLVEGSNLYYTPERVDDRVDALILNAGGIRKSYNDAGNALTLQTDFSTQCFIALDQKAAGTNGGSLVSGAWRTRDINQNPVNQIVGASLAANKITLPAGTYRAWWTAPGYITSINDRHQTRLRDVTNNVTLVVGNTIRGASQGWMVGIGQFTLAGSADIEIQHQANASRASDGFGIAGNFGEVEVYSKIQIHKVNV